jgi:hypothetical protein
MSTEDFKTNVLSTLINKIENNQALMTNGFIVDNEDECQIIVLTMLNQASNQINMFTKEQFQGFINIYNQIVYG